ncbi:hypothetical protein TNCV_3376191 [Trichonephila clavipes]|nr:hypothetical protein TNCV_3376191 [Trichonephila clavipes]
MVTPGSSFTPTALGHEDNLEWLEHQTPDWEVCVRCPTPPNTLRVHTEYVLVKSVDLKVLWDESQVQGTEEYFPPIQFHA